MVSAPLSIRIRPPLSHWEKQPGTMPERSDMVVMRRSRKSLLAGIGSRCASDTPVLRVERQLIEARGKGAGLSPGKEYDDGHDQEGTVQK